MHVAVHRPGKRIELRYTATGGNSRGAKPGASGLNLDAGAAAEQHRCVQIEALVMTVQGVIMASPG